MGLASLRGRAEKPSKNWALDFTERLELGGKAKARGRFSPRGIGKDRVRFRTQGDACMREYPYIPSKHSDRVSLYSDGSGEACAAAGQSAEAHLDFQFKISGGWIK